MTDDVFTECHNYQLSFLRNSLTNWYLTSFKVMSNVNYDVLYGINEYVYSAFNYRDEWIKLTLQYHGYHWHKLFRRNVELSRNISCIYCIIGNSEQPKLVWFTWGKRQINYHGRVVLFEKCINYKLF